MTNLAASLGTPYAFAPPEGCVLFLDETGERPYRVDRLFTQLRYAGVIARASALVFNELPGCDEPAGRPRIRDVVGRSRLGFRRTGVVRAPVRTHAVRHAHTPVRRDRTGRHRLAARSHHRGSSSRLMQRIHLIGICGTAMGTLAAMLKARGHDVRGSDQHVYPPMSDFLRQQGITLLEGYRPEHITSQLDLVVVGNAISRGNVELEEVLDRKIRYCSLPEAVRDHFLWAARSVVVAGTHGKTTTTSLTGWLLTHGGADPSVLIGGIAENFEGSYRLGGGREFVIEGDEYDSAFFDKTAKFLKYLPDIAVVNNIEFDHADIYPDLDAIRLAFRRFVNLVPRRGLLLLGADNRRCPRAGQTCALPRRNVRIERWRHMAGSRPARECDVDGVQRPSRRRADRGVRSADARGLQRSQRPGRHRGRCRGRSRHRHDGRGAPQVPRRSPADAAPRHRGRRDGL